MSQSIPEKPPQRVVSDTEEVSCEETRTGGEAAMICERCGKGEMYRMHAVWRCPQCGFKTDCCGW